MLKTQPSHCLIQIFDPVQVQTGERCKLGLTLCEYSVCVHVGHMSMFKTYTSYSICS